MMGGFSVELPCSDDALRDAVRRAEQAMRYDASGSRYETRQRRQVQRPMLQPTLWSDATYHFDSERRGELVRSIIEPAERAGFLSAGNLYTLAQSQSLWTTYGVERYYPTTGVAFSSTVRDKKGTGSGWAGIDDFDVARIDMTTVARRATEKCAASVSPVALEPGRYTTILEPQAVADLFAPLMSEVPMSRARAEFPEEVPFGKSPGMSKIGDRVIDPRITVGSDPMDPLGGFLPFSWDGTPYRPVQWIDRGILRQLHYDKGYALSQLGTDTEFLLPDSWRMSGETTSIDEMISTTKRGVLVTRLHGVQTFHTMSMTCTGYTRDGIWLIEDGKISKPIKNFRFTESPLFALNKVEQIGAPQRVFAGDYWINRAWIAPALKVQDFNFTQLADAV
jgi:predicted Zn-dependent protease